MNQFNPASSVVSLALLLLAGGCATVPGPADPRDPLESYNRAVYKFNDTVDRAILKPVAKGYDL
jgi:phospholipid-binding lipoprotein MlaA